MMAPAEPWILVLCHEFPPLGGGAGKNLQLLCKQLGLRGVEVRVWTSDPGTGRRWPYEFAVEYISVRRQERFETDLKGMAAFVAGAVLLAWRTRRSRPAAVFANLAIPAGLAGSVAARILKAPLALWHQGSDVHSGKAEGPGRFQRVLLGLVWKRSALNFFVSPGLRDMAAGYGRQERPRIMPTCPSPEILAAPIREAYGEAVSGNGAPAVGTPVAETAVAGAPGAYFLFLGRFDPVKDPVLAVEAMALCRAAGMAAFKLRMVGSGALRADVERAVAAGSLGGLVSVEPAAPFESVPALMRSAYALVVPSKVEGFNTTILEAAHFGVPAVASDAPGIRDFVRHRETGMLFPGNDAAGMAGAMQALASDPGLRDALGRNARAAALPYRPDRVADSFLCELDAIAPGFGAHAREAVAWN
ncbi:MAG TPA: glycosyltransferase family 4 protein [Fibrobacteria bacterium]|nr:glycosyltransferase family 4 protein [Fibrobacteria bacterium]